MRSSILLRLGVSVKRIRAACLVGLAVVFLPSSAFTATGRRYVLTSGPARVSGLSFLATAALPALEARYADHDAWTRWRDYPRSREYRTEPASIRVWLVSEFVALPESWTRMTGRQPGFAAEFFVDGVTGTMAVRFPDRHFFFSFPDGFPNAEAFVARFVDRYLFFVRSAPPERAFPAVVEP